MNSHADFARALLDPDAPVPANVSTWIGADPSERFAVYRNNVVVSMTDALADTFPAAHELVGDEFFREMAKVFLMQRPPTGRVMAFVGSEFPAFVDGFEPARVVPYLADVTRLEMARVRAYHAADIAPVSAGTLRAALADFNTLHRLGLRVHPSVDVIRSAHAIYGLWAAHQGEVRIEDVRPDVPESVLVFREHLDVFVERISPAEAAFIKGLLTEWSLARAANTAISIDAEFDLVGALSRLLGRGLISHTDQLADDDDYVR